METTDLAFALAILSSLVAWACFISSYRANKRLLQITQEAIDHAKIMEHRAHVYKLRLLERQGHDHGGSGPN